MKNKKVKRYSYSPHGMTLSTRGDYVHYSERFRIEIELADAKRQASLAIGCLEVKDQLKVALSANRELRFANKINSDEWRQKVESLEAAIREKDAEIERLLTQAHNAEGNAVYQQRRAEAAESRIAELARMFGVCDGGRYLNDWIAKSEQLAPHRASGGWIEIKEGCEMPPEGECLVRRPGERKIIWCDGQGWFDQGKTVGRAEDMGITHWQPLPLPPSPTLPTEKKQGE